MAEFVAYASRSRLALLVLTGFGFVALGLWLTGLFGEVPSSGRYPASFSVFVGWATIGFAALVLPVALKRFVVGGEQLRISSNGIRSKPWLNQTVPWIEITKITTWHYRNQSFIILHVRDRHKFPGHGMLRAFAGANRMLTGGDIAISLTGTDRSFAEAVTAIRQYHAIDE